MVVQLLNSVLLLRLRLGHHWQRLFAGVDEVPEVDAGNVDSLWVQGGRTGGGGK